MKRFFDFCYMTIIITVVTSLILFVLAKFELFGYLSFNKEVVLFRSLAFLFSFILWIKCLIVWSKKDKSILRFLLLLFLQVFYLVFYYPKARRNKWI